MRFIEPFLAMLAKIRDTPGCVKTAKREEIIASIEGHEIKIVDNYNYREIWVDGKQRYGVLQDSIPKKDNELGNELWRAVREAFDRSEIEQKYAAENWYNNIVDPPSNQNTERVPEMRGKRKN